MRLIDLHPAFLDSQARTGVGVEFDCPCGNHAEEHRCFIPFSNPLDGGPSLPEDRGWQRTGETFETLTLTPSIFRMVEHRGCGWHGFITAGQVVNA